MGNNLFVGTYQSNTGGIVTTGPIVENGPSNPEGGVGTLFTYNYSSKSYGTLSPATNASNVAVEEMSTNLIVGNYTDANGNVFGYTYDGTKYTLIQPAPISKALKIWSVGANLTLGSFTDGSSNVSAFAFDGKNYTIFNLVSTNGQTNQGPIDSILMDENNNLIIGAGNPTYTGGGIIYPTSYLVSLPSLLPAQTITLPTASVSYGSTNSITLPTVNGNGLAITYSLISGPGSLTGNILNILGAGTITLQASVPGNSKFAATSIAANIVVSQGSQKINFIAPGAQTYSPNASFGLMATAPGGTVSFSSGNTNVVMVNGNTANIIGAGSAVITASQSGNANYLPASSVTQKVTVSKANQVINFTPPGIKGTVSGNSYTIPYNPGSNYTLSASAPGGAVTFSSSNAKAIKIVGNVATIVGKGTTVITASQAGNSNYNAATPVTASIIIIVSSMLP